MSANKNETTAPATAAVLSRSGPFLRIDNRVVGLQHIQNIDLRPDGTAHLNLYGNTVTLTAPEANAVMAMLFPAESGGEVTGNANAPAPAGATALASPPASAPAPH